MAGHVFICKWKKTGQQWKVWIKGKPKLFGQGDTLEAAQLELEQAIWNDAENGDDVIPTVMEFDPPLPASERTKKYFTPEIYKIYGDERFELLNGNFPYGKVDTPTLEYINSLYEEGICPICKSGIGKRTEVPFRTECTLSNSEGLWLFHCQIKAQAYFFTDRFISLLTEDERSRLHFRECQVKRKTKRKFYELAGNSIASNVSVKDFDPYGSECVECGHRGFSIFEKSMDFSMQDFLCRSDLLDPLPSCFVVNINDVPTLCMTRERWDQIRGNKNAKGLVSGRIGLVNEDFCDRHPRLQTSIKNCKKCSSWPFSGWKCVYVLPVSHNEISDLPAISWLIKEMENPRSITIIRQEDTIEHMIEMAESGAKVKEVKQISFRCPDCWRLGRFSITPKNIGWFW